MRRYRIDIKRMGKWFTVSRRAYASIKAAKTGAKKLGFAQFRVVDYQKWFTGGAKDDAVVFISEC